MVCSALKADSKAKICVIFIGSDRLGSNYRALSAPASSRWFPSVLKTVGPCQLWFQLPSCKISKLTLLICTAASPCSTCWASYCWLWFRKTATRLLTVACRSADFLRLPAELAHSGTSTAAELETWPVLFSQFNGHQCKCKWFQTIWYPLDWLSCLVNWAKRRGLDQLPDSLQTSHYRVFSPPQQISGIEVSPATKRAIFFPWSKMHRRAD